VAWTDNYFGLTTRYRGLAVAHSGDRRRSWHIACADKLPHSQPGCSLQQYTGAQPTVDPHDGTLFVAAEKITVDDPNCTGGRTTLRQMIFRSTDGGKTFGPGVKIADVTQSVPNGQLKLAPGQYMRNLEFPTPALFGTTLDAAWNDGTGGHSHIRLATSTDNGASWSLSWVTQGSNDELQPALSSDTALHLLYYYRNNDNTLDVLAADSSNGTTFTARRVTTRSSPGAFTVPQLDPAVANAYMGDYIANVSDGAHQYYAWGDNRDITTNYIWPNGRHDPNVYFAKN
jgi:hypothetical protein